ncbi:hypothetical protein LOTGIDRAFT_238752 [Lottia gigantea]|uniref:BRICHOS domain-containing protein n=1 Tax=Lottia gigantea TaxID=225164 RepID=V4CCP5_LOTGI|nr:hypothetical protein LOTGIDRAFT_238752 [Lottia gigantea]ESO99674.1 hypothetical protein LOTGIDRAFT_238752 [Lottia gigantea]
MAPPTVEVGGKGTDQDIKVVFPTASTIDQPHKTNNNKKYKYFAGVVIISVVIIAAVVLGSIALHHHLNSKQSEYETEVVYKGHHIPEHARIDYTNKITYVNNSRYHEVVAANNLHEYNRQLLVFKDIENKVCYIDKLTGTFEEGVSRLSLKKVSEPTPIKRVTRSDNPVDKRILRKFAGDAIADHCKGIPTFWVIDGEPSSKGEAKGDPNIKCNAADTSVECREKRSQEGNVLSCHTESIMVQF